MHSESEAMVRQAHHPSANHPERGRRTPVLRKLAISPRGCGEYPVPLRCGNVLVALATVPQLSASEASGYSWRDPAYLRINLCTKNVSRTNGINATLTSQLRCSEIGGTSSSRLADTRYFAQNAGLGGIFEMGSSLRLKVIMGIGFLSILFLVGAERAGAATNISSSTTDHWAWNDLVGWIDFYNTQSVNVFSNRLEGYASSSARDISLNCNTTSIGNICGSSDYKVTNDGLGNLSDWGWNDEYGWISFDCNNNGGCGASNYRVYINGTTGDFNNYAWNDLIGWVSFNCADPGVCGTSNYKVNTSWRATSTTATLTSSTFDTGSMAGAQLNSVLWHGSVPVGTSVRFQFATSNVSAGPWTYVGTDGTSNTYYNTGQGVALKLGYTPHNNNRYFRYRVFLQSNQSQTLSPRVDDIIVNWSP